MEWKYRGMMDKDGVCTVREVFYEPDGTISSFAVDPACPTGQSRGASNTHSSDVGKSTATLLT